MAAVSKRVPQVHPDCLRDIKFLKKGMFGHVRKVKVVGSHPSLRKNESGNHNNQSQPLLLASKHINLNSSDPEDAARQLANEANILSILNHQNIIKLRAVCSGSFSESFDEHSRGYFLLFDFLDETLQDRLESWRKEKRRPRSLYSSMCRKITKSSPSYQDIHGHADEASAIGIANGLAYLHSKQIVWRDLKPANVGYFRNEDGHRTTWTVKLIDFGMARSEEDCMQGECCGSLGYMSPEAMRGKCFTSKDDIFSFAVVLAEIYSLRIPYPKSNGKTDLEWFDSIRERVEKGEKSIQDLENDIQCPKIRSLVYDCWSPPTHRPTSTEVETRLHGILRPIMRDKFVVLDETSTTYHSQEEGSDFHSNHEGAIF
eukprot:CAMPEP_0116144850 /NCGR_PEP_ID=MMETSP0329-20121206/16248_1 /TAXON_ID=697910 /ORGANISM="Pseudo-nitzschia arenysensis, Strain B593" /LENGTH=371 /DNA_ID=CAMNT_0003640353 /DNA_START=555 /DNA_END=1670 /DNA_ORIENTATION=-